MKFEERLRELKQHTAGCHCVEIFLRDAAPQIIALVEAGREAQLLLDNPKPGWGVSRDLLRRALAALDEQVKGGDA